MGKFSSYAAKISPTVNDKLLIDDVADGTTPTGMEKIITIGQLLALGLGTVVAPSSDPTGATDAGALNAALASPGIVLMQSGIWYWNAPIIVPAGTRLTGMLANVNDIATYGVTVNTPLATWAQGTAPYAAAVILGQDAQADTFNLNCHFANSNAMDGITSSANNVLVHDINIYNGPQYGINARGNTWRGVRVMVTQAKVNGFLAPASDSDWIDCNASASQAAGWVLNNAINSKLIGCRAEFNATRGFQVTGDNTATGSFSMIGCSTDRNGTDGVYINNTGTSHILISGMMQRRDGSTGGSTSAINVDTANTAPVIIAGHSIFPGFNDDGSGSDTPLTGITIGAAATYVAVSNAMVHAITTPVSGTITQVRSVATRTGAWNSPSAVTMLPDTDAAGSSWQSLLLAPSGALAETYPRMFAGGLPALSSGQTYVTAIPLQKGMTVTNITYITGTGAETGGSHGWCGLLDSAGKVLAVSADQTGATVWSPGGHEITIAMGTPYAVTVTGVYYLAVSVTASGMPNLMGINSMSNTSAAGQSPVLSATGGTNNTPPSVGTTLTLTAQAACLYGYVS